MAITNRFFDRKHFLFVINLFIVIVCTCGFVLPQSNRNKKPLWIPSPPNAPGYYNGLGQSTFYKSSDLTYKRALANAIEDLSYQIYSEIGGKTEDSIIEKGGLNKESFKSIVTITTKNCTKGFQIQDRWNNSVNGEWWIWIRLSIQDYEDQLAREMDMYKNRVFQDLRNFDNLQAQAVFERSIGYLLSGLYHSRFFIGQPQTIEYPIYSGIFIDLEETIKERTYNFCRNFDLETEGIPREVVGGVPASQRVICRLTYLSVGRNGKIPIKNLPLRITSTTMDTIIYTDGDGIAPVLIGTPPSKKSFYTFTILIDFNSIQFDKIGAENPLKVDLNRLIGLSPLKVEIPVRRVKIFINSNETIDNLTVSDGRQFVKNALQESLSTMINASCVNSEIEADYLININVSVQYFQTVSAGTKVIYCFIANLSGTVNSPRTNTVLYTFQLAPSPKEFGQTRSQAANNAHLLAAKLMGSEIISQIICFISTREFE